MPKTKTKKKNAKRICYIIFLALFLALLIFANDILMCFFQENKVKRTYIDLNSFKKDPVTFGILFSKASDNLLEEYTIDGWAFAESGKENPKKSIKLYLVSVYNDVVYEIETAKKEDELLGFKEKGYQVNGNMNGFSTVFSAINMRDGVYQLYVQCWENETNYGLKITDYCFQYSNGSLNEYDFVSREIEPPPANVLGENLESVADVLEEKNGKLEIYGYAYIKEGIGLRKTVQVTDSQGVKKYYATVSRQRYDFVENIGIEDENSGFYASIPIVENQGEYVDIEVILQMPNGIYLPKISFRYFFASNSWKAYDIHR